MSAAIGIQLGEDIVEQQQRGLAHDLHDQVETPAAAGSECLWQRTEASDDNNANCGLLLG